MCELSLVSTSLLRAGITALLRGGTSPTALLGAPGCMAQHPGGGLHPSPGMWQQRAAQTCPHSPGFSLWVLSSSEPATFSHLLEMPGVTDGSLDRILPFSPQGSSHNNPVVLG